jgi:hypothetical protein
MRYARKIALFFSAAVLLLTLMTVDGSAQTRYTKRIQRPVAVRYYYPVSVRRYWGNPYWYSRSWYDPFYDPYFNDPYLRERRERYYREKAVRDASRKLRKDREKYTADGVLTFKEREKLAKRSQKYNKAVSKLAKHYREY